MSGTVLDTGAKRVNGTDKPALTMQGSTGRNKEVKQFHSMKEISNMH